MKIASWNVNSLNVRLPQLQQWLQDFAPDVVGLQETKLEDHRFPDGALAELGYRSVFHGQKTYNGVALLARGRSLDEVQVAIPGFEDAQARAIAATVDGVRIVNLYVVNGQDLGTDKYAYKLRWLEAVHDWVAGELRRHPRLVVLGDFNIAPDDRDVHDPKAWADKILCSAPEREAFKRLLALGLVDSFRLFEQSEKSFSWWDYRMLGFQRNLGLRIDHILLSAPLAARCTAAGIERELRKLERPSDHAPVTALLGS